MYVNKMAACLGGACGGTTCWWAAFPVDLEVLFARFSDRYVTTVLQQRYVDDVVMVHVREVNSQTENRFFAL